MKLINRETGEEHVLDLKRERLVYWIHAHPLETSAELVRKDVYGKWTLRTVQKYLKALSDDGIIRRSSTRPPHYSLRLWVRQLLLIEAGERRVQADTPASETAPGAPDTGEGPPRRVVIYTQGRTSLDEIDRQDQSSGQQEGPGDPAPSPNAVEKYRWPGKKRNLGSAGRKEAF